MEAPRSKSLAKSNGGVRIVGKIRPFLDSELRSSPQNRTQISISRNGGGCASICFGDQPTSKKDCYKLDWCYEKDEDVAEVFSKEVKPLLQGILKGINGCVIAYGARGSGKTQLIQGSEENPGLATLAIYEILLAVEELGGSVSISCYEVCQDRVYNLLDPKGSEVLIMEDANRRIQLRGLSKIPVKSTSDFMKSYFHGCNERKFSEKGTDNAASRSHKGLTVHFSYVDKESNRSHEGKMNFVDLAGFEDMKSKSSAKSTLNEIAKVTKSLYALLNVVCALNSSETYIPYRETKLTRLLQDCLHVTSGAVLFTCMNPTACQDTIHAVCLASRSCQVVNKHRCDSTKNNKSASRLVPSCSPMNGRSQAMDSSVKKFEISKLDSVEKKGCGTSSLMKKRSQPLKKKVGTSLRCSNGKNINEPSSASNGRRRFNSKSPIISPNKNVPGGDEHVILKENHTGSPAPDEQGICLLGDHKDTRRSLVEGNVPVGDEHIPLKACHTGSPTSVEQDVIEANENNELQEELDLSLLKLDTDKHDDTKDKNKQTPIPDVGRRSPTLTEKLREISNSLRLASSKPICVSTTLDGSCQRPVTMDSMEPKTPKTPFHLRLYGDSRFEDMGTPQDILKARSTGLKKSLVRECLTFLNSANKEELKELKGIGEKRAAYIIQLREQTPEPFKEIDDLKDMGISSKEIKGMMLQLLGNF